MKLELSKAILEKSEKYLEKGNYDKAAEWLIFHKFVLDFNPDKKDIESRQIKFANDVSEYLFKYEKDMLYEFWDYWTEHEENGRLMRFEMSKNKPFNIGRRLGRWSINQKNYGKNIGNSKKGATGERIAEIFAAKFAEKG